MFTGLIEKIGVLKGREKDHGGTTLTIGATPWNVPLAEGESIAVNGVCFTVTGTTATSFTCDALDETLAKTNLGTKMIGSSLNLERALRVGDHIGGHFVSGHVDGVAVLSSVRAAGRDKVVRIKCDVALLKGMVMKGSVACDGTSLTISFLADTFFEVNVIPFTWANTGLWQLIEGDTVNIETDMLGKYVRRCIEGSGAGAQLDFTDLRRAGFIE